MRIQSYLLFKLGLSAQLIEVILGHFVNPGAVHHEIAFLGTAVLAVEARKWFLARVQPKVVDGRLFRSCLLAANVAGILSSGQDGKSLLYTRSYPPTAI